MKTSVITTINKYENTFIDKLIDHDYNCVVVGDLKTPHESYLNQNNITYVNPECETFPEFSKSLPFNHYCRKNLGYLHAIKQGATTVLDTDDDNFPTSDIHEWINLGIKKVLGPDLPNILNRFSKFHIWSRGYPLELVNENLSMIIRNVNRYDTGNVGIVQSLVNGDPDVDAVFRLTSKNYSPDFNFHKGLGFIFAKGIFSQGNTQSTLWIKQELFHLLYIPISVSFRFCDILKMYVAQRCMWEAGLEFAVTSPFFHQKRNAHNYMQDFNSETSMYACLLNLLTNLLPKIKLKGDTEDIIRIYEVLEKHRITQSEELSALEMYLKNIN